MRDRLEALLARGGEIPEFSMPTVCDKRELFSRPRLAQFRLAEVARIFGREVMGRAGR